MTESPQNRLSRTVFVSGSEWEREWEVRNCSDIRALCKGLLRRDEMFQICLKQNDRQVKYNLHLDKLLADGELDSIAI